ncbi:replication stress response regulator SDE2 [Xenopus laevis]|uniref:Splicing regulator SDE2 n=1 Tax=Xenopus laevis TaxID=8355 RepID=SDE2_XENLA|nr:splicing regulator SDE2 [Xenopus laevis]Q6NRI5.1 RecName: Full=Splicing regulator SDE2; AltName: Full=Replication stress response regulator SDE2; Flags: Precursor [Xenopus laevis]AAH70765.1 MGC83793 protein [Xenopus laevis]
MASVWVRDALSGRLQLVRVAPGAVALDLLYQEGTAIPLTDFYVKCNGHLADLEEKLQDGHTYSIEPRLCGGKGGFGSMLRALGAQIEKTTNREACRDLSGRRLRDVNHEKAMAEWTKKQADREAEKEQRRLERLQRKLAEPKHYFTDPEYHKQCHDMSERLEEAVIKGLQASSSDVVSAESDDTRKRKKDMYASKGTSSKKKCFWTGLEGLEASSSSDSSSDSDLDESPCSSSSGSKHHEYIKERLGSPESSSSSDGLEEASSAGSHQMLKGQTSGSESDNILEGPSSSAGSLHVPQLQSSSKGTEHIQEPQTCPAESEQNTETPNISDGSEENPTTVTNSECKSVTSAANTGQNEQILDDGHKFASPTLLEPKSELQQSSNTEPSSIDLVAYKTVAELEALGLEKLKLELVALGLKCGGTLQERAARLFSVRGLARDQIDPSLFAKPAKAKKK